MSEKQKYIDAMETQFDEWNAEIDALAGRADELGNGDRKVLLLQELDRLRDRRLEAEKMLNQLRDSTGDGWETLSEGVDKEWSDLKESLLMLSEKFKSPYTGLGKEDMAVEAAEIGNCDADKCAYNRNARCHALSITVGSSHAKCDTFMQSGETGGVDGNGTVGACHMKDCRFNEHLECAAGAITVETHAGHADCITYVAR